MTQGVASISACQYLATNDSNPSGKDCWIIYKLHVNIIKPPGPSIRVVAMDLNDIKQSLNSNNDADIIDVKGKPL